MESRSTVLRRDMLTLRPAMWLNDEVLNFGIELLRQRLARRGEDEGWPRCFFANTFFFNSLMGEKWWLRGGKIVGECTGFNYENVRRWERRVMQHIFEFDRILHPINTARAHWSLGMIDLQQREIYYFDSLGLSGMPRVLPNLARWLGHASKGVIDASDGGKGGWVWLDHGKTIPQQGMEGDCGVFVFQYCEVLSRGSSEFSFTLEDMRYFRRRMCHEICVGFKQ